MTTVDVRVPQMGEGLREVLVLKLLKRPGDFVQRDEIIYVMETDKAVLEVESPQEGVLKEWLVEEARVLPVGAAIARIEVAGGDSHGQGTENASREATQQAVKVVNPATSQRPVFVPPRTRAYCKSLAIPEDQIPNIPAASGTLMPADVDRYLERRPKSYRESQVPEVAAFHDRPLPSHQRVLNYRMIRSAQLVISGTVKLQLDWECLLRAVKTLRRDHPGVPASDFETFAFAVARATRQHPEFRSVLLKDDVIREFEHLELGLAVQASGKLAMAVVSKADCLDFPSFVAATQERVRKALSGEDQVCDQVPLHIDYVARLKVTDGTPVLVAPAVAVVFLCAPTGAARERKANLGVCFDHRLIDGACAARFLASVLEQIRALAPDESAGAG